MFASLGLAIVDEQHRFGVEQRLRLQRKGKAARAAPAHDERDTHPAHPRDELFADLDISVIDELPPGRTPVQTLVIPEERRDEVVMRVRRACRAGGRPTGSAP